MGVCGQYHTLAALPMGPHGISTRINSIIIIIIIIIMFILPSIYIFADMESVKVYE
jgi:hypothetical protein